MLIGMGLIAWFRNIFTEQEDPLETETKLAFLRLEQELQSQTVTEIVERLKHAEEFKNLVANAFSNLDNRLDNVEKMAGFLYEKIGEYEGRVASLEDRTTSHEFSKLVADATEEN